MPFLLYLWDASLSLENRPEGTFGDKKQGVPPSFARGTPIGPPQGDGVGSATNPIRSYPTEGENRQVLSPLSHKFTYSLLKPPLPECIIFFKKALVQSGSRNSCPCSPSYPIRSPTQPSSQSSLYLSFYYPVDSDPRAEKEKNKK